MIGTDATSEEGEMTDDVGETTEVDGMNMEGRRGEGGRMGILKPVDEARISEGRQESGREWDIRGGEAAVTWEADGS